MNTSFKTIRRTDLGKACAIGKSFGVWIFGFDAGTLRNGNITHDENLTLMAGNGERPGSCRGWEAKIHHEEPHPL